MNLQSHIEEVRSLVTHHEPTVTQRGNIISTDMRDAFNDVAALTLTSFCSSYIAFSGGSEGIEKSQHEIERIHAWEQSYR